MVSIIHQRMKESLPSFYDDILEFKEILSVEAKELDSFDLLAEQALDQMSYETATWALSRYEQFHGIKVDETKPIDQRRSVLKSKLRSAGITTKALIINVASAYSNGSVDVTEDGTNYTIIITFTGTLGVPPNVKDLEKALREIIPAHFHIDFVYTYLLIKDIHNLKTLAEMESITLNKFAGGA
jgi:uncharacterized protein YmfQ (DUF2313 family)